MQMVEAAVATKQPSRHMTYHDVSEALAEPGCARCRLVANAAEYRKRVT